MLLPRYYRIKKFLRAALETVADPVEDGFFWRLRERFANLVYDSTPGYYGQFGQDAFVNEIVLGGLRNGVFVDIGANDGMNLSNSYYFEKSLGWSGLCVEPNPMLAGLVRERRSCAVAQVCAGATEGTVDFLFFEDDRHVYGKSLENEGAEEGGKVIQVPRRDINALLAEHGLGKIDFLSIDIEGGELEVFSAIDLKKFPVEVVAIEDNDGGPRIERFMRANGYQYLAKLGCDRIYRKRS